MVPASVRFQQLQNQGSGTDRDDQEPGPEKNPLRSVAQRIDDAADHGAQARRSDARFKGASGLGRKRALVEKIRQQREAAARVEAAFVDAGKTIRNVEKNLWINPEATVAQATQLITQIADSILSAPELALHVMGDKLGGEEMYFHSLNVTTLSLMMARDIGLTQDGMRMLGMGALFHDIGRREVPNKILMKTEPWTQAEKTITNCTANMASRPDAC